MTMLFSHIPRLLWHDDMISLMKVGQLWGHSCFKTETRTRLSLLRRVRSVRRLSSLLESWMMKLTMKFRMPGRVSDMQAPNCRYHTLTLVAGQHLPPRHDHIVENLKPEICLWLARCWTASHDMSILTLGLRVLRIGQDLVDEKPRVGILLELHAC